MIRYILFTVLLTSSFLIQAQDEDPLYTRAGFKAGINYADVSGIDSDGRTRVHLGAVIEFPITSRFYIQPEILYSAQGYIIKEPNGVENKISLNYLTLPIISKIYFTEKFSLETGPRFATLANSTNSIGDETDEFFDSFEDFDFSWSFGAGYKLESGLFFQLRYNLGLSKINNSSLDTNDRRNAVAQLSVGYLFKTKNNRRQEYGEE
ncbi:porin family protein [Aquimarina sp. MMG016]|uniref:porin family protein n=1 Tax=Aquimarina sp. MMG016 TaxID=2822690 RepID=UPI001B3A0122|nr:porin family protein [Aquimarina sp. MMG016]MBQ4819360.1 PorT family protein [Aquimarina sp. MMG016]